MDWLIVPLAIDTLVFLEGPLKVSPSIWGIAGCAPLCVPLTAMVNVTDSPNDTRL